MSKQWETEDLRDYFSMCLSDAERKFYQTLLDMEMCDYARYHSMWASGVRDCLKEFRKMLIDREAE